MAVEMKQRVQEPIIASKLQSLNDLPARPQSSPPASRAAAKSNGSRQQSDNHESGPDSHRSTPKTGSRRTGSSAAETFAYLIKEQLEREQERNALLTAELNEERTSLTQLLSRHTSLQTSFSTLQSQYALLQHQIEQFKIQLEAQQAEVVRAQDVVAEVDRQRNDAEARAARGRERIRRLETESAVRTAREGGWRVGFQQGAREAGTVLGIGRKRSRSLSQSRRSRMDSPLDEDAEEEVRGDAPRSPRARTPTPERRSQSGDSSNTTSAETAVNQQRQLRPRSALPEAVSRSTKARSRLHSRTMTAPVTISFQNNEAIEKQAQVREQDGATLNYPQTRVDVSADEAQPTLGFETDHIILGRGRAGSDASTRLSEYELVTPPRRHPIRERSVTPTLNPRTYFRRNNTQPETSTRTGGWKENEAVASLSNPSSRPRSPGNLSDTPRTRERELLPPVPPLPPNPRSVVNPMLEVPYNSPPDKDRLAPPLPRRDSGNKAPFQWLRNRLPFYRSNSTGSTGVHIEIEPPSHSPSDPSPVTIPDPILLSPDVAESDDMDLPEEEDVSTPALLDSISRENDLSYFPDSHAPAMSQPHPVVTDAAGYPLNNDRRGRPDGSDRSTSGRRRSKTPTRYTESYETAPVPRGVVYPDPPVPRPATAASSSSISTSTSTTASTSSSASPKSQSSRRRALSLGRVSPATLHKPFQSFPDNR